MNNSSIELKESDFELNFLLDDEPIVEKTDKNPYYVLITDDDKEVHAATRLLLRNFKFEGHPLELIHAYSGSEARKILTEKSDIALIFLDVVMEESDTGLKLVNFIRKELKNQKIRIILRTGQPGEAPEEKVIEAYDINDYRLKTDLSATRLFTSVYEALRSYRDLMEIESHRKGLEQIIQLSSQLFTADSIESFYACVLNQIIKFEKEGTAAICFRDDCEPSGFVFYNGHKSCCSIVAATGKYEAFIGKNVDEVDMIKDIVEQAYQHLSSKKSEIIKINEGYLIYRMSPFEFKTFIYVEGKTVENSLDILKEFLFHYELALNNYLGKQKLCKINCEVIKTYAYDEAVEYVHNHSHYKEEPALIEAFLNQFKD